MQACDPKSKERLKHGVVDSEHLILGCIVGRCGHTLPAQGLSTKQHRVCTSAQWMETMLSVPGWINIPNDATHRKVQTYNIHSSTDILTLPTYLSKGKTRSDQKIT